MYSYNNDSSPMKVLRIVPGSAGQVTYKVDYELNGVGGQASPTSSETTPLSVTLQLGEQVVVSELLRTSIPTLVGWSVLGQVASDNTVQAAHGPSY